MKDVLMRLIKTIVVLGLLYLVIGCQELSMHPDYLMHPPRWWAQKSEVE